MNIIINNERVNQVHCELHNETLGFIGIIKNATALYDVQVQIKRNKLAVRLTDNGKPNKSAKKLSFDLLP